MQRCRPGGAGPVANGDLRLPSAPETAVELAPTESRRRLLALFCVTTMSSSDVGVAARLKAVELRPPTPALDALGWAYAGWLSPQG
jgi:hypothetical protein